MTKGVKPGIVWAAEAEAEADEKEAEMLVQVSQESGRDVAAALAETLDWSEDDSIESARATGIDYEFAGVRVRVGGRWYVLQLWEVR